MRVPALNNQDWKLEIQEEPFNIGTFEFVNSGTCPKGPRHPARVLQFLEIEGARSTAAVHRAEQRAALFEAAQPSQDDT